MVARGNQWYPRTNSDAPSIFCDYQSHIMVIRPKNMPQTSNSLLSPRTNSDAHLMILDYHPPIMGIKPKNMPQITKFPIITH